MRQVLIKYTILKKICSFTQSVKKSTFPMYQPNSCGIRNFETYEYSLFACQMIKKSIS